MLTGHPPNHPIRTVEFEEVENRLEALETHLRIVGHRAEALAVSNIKRALADALRAARRLS
jgi:hypothetical protein